MYGLTPPEILTSTEPLQFPLQSTLIVLEEITIGAGSITVVQLESMQPLESVTITQNVPVHNELADESV